LTASVVESPSYAATREAPRSDSASPTPQRDSAQCRRLRLHAAMPRGTQDGTGAPLSRKKHALDSEPSGTGGWQKVSALLDWEV